MPSPASLDGRVALVLGAGEGIGRAIALALGAKKAAVVVAGPEERPLAEAVGEIACGAGKARHVVCAASADLPAAVARALEIFGRLDVVVCAAGEPDALLAAALPAMNGGAFVLASEAPRQGFVARAARELGARKIAVIGLQAPAGVDPDRAAPLGAFLASDDARALSGHTITLGV